MTRQEAAKAVLAEVEFFSLKKLEEKARKALGGKAPTMLWPLRNQGDGRYQPMPKDVEAVSALFGREKQVQRSVFYPGLTDCRTLYRFTDLQFQIMPDAPTKLRQSTVLFLNRAQQASLDQARGGDVKQPKPTHVEFFEFWSSGTQQASVTIDGQPLSLKVLLTWAAYPSSATARIPALKPLNDIFHPELIPELRQMVTLRVHSAIGYFVDARLQLLHLNT